MIYEFVVNPKMLSRWCDHKDFRFFMDKFGIGTPRIIAAFPGQDDWQKEVKSEANNKNDMEKKRIEELLMRFKEKMIHRSGLNYHNEWSWIDNVEIEHTQCNFHAIITDENPRNNKIIISDAPGGGITTGNVLWDVASQSVVERTVPGYRQAVSAMLSNCTEVVFIDPYFAPRISNYQKLFKEYFSCLLQKRNRIVQRRIEIHCGENDTTASFTRECNKYLPSIIPKDKVVTIKRWREKIDSETLHNRYILTDIGGVQFGQSQNPKKGTFDEITILSRESYVLRWKQYVSNPAFEAIESPISIVGTLT